MKAIDENSDTAHDDCGGYDGCEMCMVEDTAVEFDDSEVVEGLMKTQKQITFSKSIEILLFVGAVWLGVDLFLKLMRFFMALLWRP